MTITAQQLLAAAPRAHSEIVAGIVDHVDAVFAKYSLVTSNRVLGFLSTALEESGGFTALTECLCYSAERAHEVFPRKFPTAESAAPYAFQPEKFANFVYGGRMGNSDPDDGWRFRGQGLIQITGHDNFASLAKKTGLPLLDTPAMVTSSDNMLECSVALFVEYPDILSYCDDGDWHAVWALVGSGRANGPIINLANHEAALAALQRAGIGGFTAVSSGGLGAAVEPNGFLFGSAGWAQKRLTAAGFDPQGVDGSWGGASRKALREFEAAKGLTVDAGILGPETIKALTE
jgi:putative chitinase